MRTATINRKTSETSIDVVVNLDGTGSYAVSTGIGFFDHMLEQLSRHSLIDLEVKTVGDLHIDQHHTVEDTGLAIGEAINKALEEIEKHAKKSVSVTPKFPRLLKQGRGKSPAEKMVRWLSGRKRRFAKALYPLKGTQGSNPCLTVSI